MIALRHCAIASLALALSACAGSNFGAGGQKAAHAPSPATAPSSPAGEGGDLGKPGKADLTPPEGATPEQEAIGKCLAAWGKHPFDATVYEKYREIFAAVSVLGGGGYAVEDTEVTQGPALILVHAAVGVLGQANYLLMNPNGWYCMMVGVNVMASSQVDLQCTAKLADNKVNVNVGSTASASSSVGVNVFSNVKVERKKSADGPGCQ